MRLHELKISTLNSYIKKANIDAIRHSKKGEKERKQGDHAESEKSFDKSDKRTDGITAAKNKLPGFYPNNRSSNE